MKILLGLSGGVDSSVAALILKEQGHQVIGARMTIKPEGLTNVLENGNSCYGSDEKKSIEAARKVAQQLDIPFYVFDCSKRHKEIVLDNFKEEYLGGRTPNPCILCNALVKFGALIDEAKKSGLEFDKFATGHYARVEEILASAACGASEGAKQYLLKRGLDPKKDQSYFLYRLNQEQLSNIIFPLGAYSKEQIREIALKNGLITANKPDSQDFYDGDYNDLLNVEAKKGNIVDVEGKILGTHQGIWNYTVGQRKGLPGGACEPLYVLELRECANEVVVGFAKNTLKQALVANNPNWILKPTMPLKISVKIRSTQAPIEADLKEDGGKLIVEFKEPQKSVTPGQSVVFYDGDIVLGGAIIEETF